MYGQRITHHEFVAAPAVHNCRTFRWEKCAMKGKAFNMKIDIFHALEDFLDAYDNHAEMVVTEAIANAIDVKARTIRVELTNGPAAGRHVSFFNDGPPMTKREFDNYHVVSRSSKSKGSGIGFAGIGAKVYLAAWTRTVIHTETSDGTGGYASDMYVRNNVLKAKYVEPTIKERGTLYRVDLTQEDYDHLESNLADLVVRVFDPAILDGLAVVVNGKRIEAWHPEYEFKRHYRMTIRGKKYRFRLVVASEDIPAEKAPVQYHVSGKIISTKKPDWLYDVRPAYQKRIHVYVDALALSDMLNLNKTGFKQGSGMVVSQVFKEIDNRILSILKDNGYVGDNMPDKWVHTQLTKFFENLFKDPKYAFLNPEARRGKGPGAGAGSGGTESEIEGVVATPSSPDPDTNKPDNASERNAKKKLQDRQRGGRFTIGWVARPDDKRDGWLDQTTNKLIINMEHPLFLKYEKNVIARNQRVGVILTSVLIANSVHKREDMSVADAFKLQTELLTLARDAMW